MGKHDKKRKGFLFFKGGRKKKSSNSLRYRRRDDFLKDHELAFYKVLLEVVGSKYVICSKVCLSDIFYVYSREVDVRTIYMNMMSKKQVNFLLCKGEDMTPVCGIQLENQSVDKKTKQVREEFIEEVFANASVALVRFPMKNAYTISEVRYRIDKGILKYKNYEPFRYSDIKINKDKDTKAIELKGITLSEVAITKEVEKEANNEAQIDSKKGSSHKNKKNNFKYARRRKGLICSECGALMVIKEVKRGPKKGTKYYGCTNYPKCKAVEEA